MTNQQLFDYLLQQHSNCDNEQGRINISIKIKELIETSDDFDIAYAAFSMCYNYTSDQIYAISPEWVKAQLARNIGDVALMAVWLNNIKPWIFDVQWAKHQIEQSYNGDVAWAAYLLCVYNLDKDEIDIDWAKQQIERGIGDVDFAMQQLVNHLEGLNLRYYPYYENKDKYLNPLAE